MVMKKNCGKIMTFGETMLRFSPEGYNRFLQAERFHRYFGGAEANVAVSLSYMGFETGYVTKLPENELAEAAIGYLNSFQVDTSQILRGGERMGIFFMEQGVSLRSGKVIYDRAHSSIAEAEPEEFNWREIFKDAVWFHITGITPALSDTMAKACIDACRTAKELGVTVSFDVNYRSTLWTEEKARKVIHELSSYVDICFANEKEIEQVYGIPSVGNQNLLAEENHEIFQHMAEELMKRYPFKQVALTLLETIYADEYRWQAMLYDHSGTHYSRLYDIKSIDRDGPGDAFSAGLIAGLLEQKTPQEAVEFGAAAAALKFSIPGDINFVRYEEIQSLAEHSGAGDVKR